MVARNDEGTCVLTGKTAEIRHMIRFVIDPGDRIMADLKNELPGPGIRIGAAGEELLEAIVDGRFQAAAISGFSRAPRSIDEPQGFVAGIDALMARGCLARLGLMRGAGQVITGFEKAGSVIASGKVFCLLEAADAKEGGARKIRGLVLAAQDKGLARRMVIVDLFDRDALSQAMGLDNVVHGVITNHRVATAFIDEALRLAAFRGKALPVLGASRDAAD